MVRDALGEPDEKSFVSGTEIWTYEPTQLDPNTETVFIFTLDGSLIDVRRTVHR